MTCDLKKLGCFFFLSPWDETFCANDVSWYEHNADVGVCHEDAYNSPCPWPPSQEGSKHSEVTPWAVSCQTRDPHYHQGVAWPWIEAEGDTALLCFWWCHSHTREKTHSLHQSEPLIHARRTSLQHDDDDTIHRFPHTYNTLQQLQIGFSAVMFPHPWALLTAGCMDGYTPKDVFKQVALENPWCKVKHKATVE